MSSQSSQLHQAVELAQSGQRDQARQLLWQFIQTNPDHEVAWLWLASVAADQAEYQRALNEVLRINPQHPQARKLLDDFQRQFGSQSPPGSYAPPQAPPQTPPPAAQPYGYQSPPPQSPQPGPSPSQSPLPQSQPYSGPVQGAGSQLPAYSPPPPPPPERIIERERVIERRGRRGCLGCALPGCGCLGCSGCWQSCLVALVLLIVLPALACAGLSYGNFSLYFLDIPASVLPGKFGTKTIKFETNQYEIEMEAPRSWYLVTDTDDMWLIWRDALDSTVAFEDTNRAWEDFETWGVPVILDVNPFLLYTNGREIVFVQDNTMLGDYTCEAVHARADANPNINAVYEYDNGLCGYRQDELLPHPSTTPVFESFDPPVEEWHVTLVTPVDDTTALTWTLAINEELKGLYKGRLDRLAESVKINKK